VAGAVLLAGAIAVGVVALTRGSDASPVAVLANSVAVMKPESGRVVGDVPIGGRPVGIAIGEGAVWVANGDDQTVLRIDPETFEVVKTIGGLGSEVTDIAVGYGSVWVAGGNDGTLTRIDPRLNAPERVIELGNPDAILAQPVFLVEAGAGGVWVLRGRQLLRIDPRTNEVDRSTRVPPVRSVSLGAGAGAAWLVPGSRLLRIDAASEGITGEKLLPGWNASDPLVVDGSLWLVAWADPTQILRLDPGSLTQEQSVAVPAELPFGLAATADALWTADHGSGAVWRIDRADGGSVPVADVGHHPISIAAGEGSVWVGVQGRKLTYG
jgi:streptogramin lyase